MFHFDPFFFAYFGRRVTKILSVLFDDCSFCSRPPSSLFWIRLPWRSLIFTLCVMTPLHNVEGTAFSSLYTPISYISIPSLRCLLHTGVVCYTYPHSLRLSLPNLIFGTFSVIMKASAREILPGQLLSVARAKRVTISFSSTSHHLLGASCSTGMSGKERPFKFWPASSRIRR